MSCRMSLNLCFSSVLYMGITGLEEEGDRGEPLTSSPHIISGLHEVSVLHLGSSLGHLAQAMSAVCFFFFFFPLKVTISLFLSSIILKEF